MSASTSTYRRPRYFAGQLLTESELGDEQAHRIAKDRLHNRMLHGTGVVCGLQVVCHPQCRGFVTVQPGYAIDPCGNDIVVGAAVDFDVIREINRCRDARRRVTREDCEGIVPPGRERCEGAEDEWCVTLAYEEQESRPLTALRHAAGCGCGCAGDAPPEANGHAQPAVCEPTRVVETFRLGVAPGPVAEDATPSFTSQLQHCLQAFGPLLSEPSLEGLDRTQARRACCDYLRRIDAVADANPALRCALRARLARLTCTDAGPDRESDADVVGRAAEVIAAARVLVETSLLDCACLAMLPPCPEPPADQRLVLACVTVQGEDVVRVCPGPHRRQVVGFPMLDYWLAGAVPYADESLHTLLGSEGSPAIFLLALASQRHFAQVLEHYCCDGNLTLETVFGVGRGRT
jgi:hypothetical protein